jgi:hypothetical protein
MFIFFCVKRETMKYCHRIKKCLCMQKVEAIRIVSYVIRQFIQSIIICDKGFVNNIVITFKKH